VRRVSLLRLIVVFAWTGLSSLGGGRSAYFHESLVRRRGWIRHDEFVQDFTLSQVMPGPNFSNLAVVLGYRLAGFAGGVWGLLAVVLPGALILLAASRLYAEGAFGTGATLLMRGLSAAVVGLVAVTSLRIMCGSLRGARGGDCPAHVRCGRPAPSAHRRGGAGDDRAELRPLPLRARSASGAAAHPAASGERVMANLALLTWTFLWLSFLCVGGGLGVVPEMERQAVTIHHWLTAREFVDGYTLSQLTPGPSMLVAVFVGHRVHGLLGAALAGLAMFVPTSVLAIVISHHWQQWRDRPWAVAAERALLPVGVGLMAGGVYTLARTAIHDGVTAALAVATALVVATDRVPPVVAILAAGAVGWLLWR